MKKIFISSALILPLTLGLGINSATVFADNPTQNEQNLTDSVITTKVKAKILADKTLNPLNISVTTENGVVTLNGQVDSDTEYEQAVSLAQSTDGVNDVNTNDLNVKSSDSPMTDLGITARIKGKLMRDKLFSHKKIAYWGFSIETQNQVVYLKGKVNSNEIKNNIIQVVKSVDGVKSVEDLLKVKHS
ncbi:MAG: BON domain-containing protein [Legionellales bacterium]|nr:BON domain-containing protein [Legionellales bacterium]